MKNTFYTGTVKRHLQKLVEERDYYLAQRKEAKDEKTKEGYRLMADFYDALITTAENHIEENS